MNTNLNKILFLIIGVLSLYSCDQIRDNYFDQQAIANYTSPYQGVWNGSFSGGISGNLKIHVFKAGNVEVTRISDNISETFYGTVLDDGSFQNTKSLDSGFQIFGSLRTSNNSANGIWKQNGISGNWQVSKQ